MQARDPTHGDVHSGGLLPVVNDFADRGVTARSQFVKSCYRLPFWPNLSSRCISHATRYRVRAMKTLPVVAVVVALLPSAAFADRVDLLARAAAKSNAGDHAAAIALYEQAYVAQPDVSLLPIIGAEYRRAGAPLEAMSHFCDYVTSQPKGPHAPQPASSSRPNSARSSSRRSA